MTTFAIILKILVGLHLLIVTGGAGSLYMHILGDIFNLNLSTETGSLFELLLTPGVLIWTLLMALTVMGEIQAFVYFSREIDKWREKKMQPTYYFDKKGRVYYKDKEGNKHYPNEKTLGAGTIVREE